METVKRSGGRPHAGGTVLAAVMAERSIQVYRVSAALAVSHRQVYNYLTRRRPLTMLQIAALVELMDMDADELVGPDCLLLETKGQGS